MSGIFAAFGITSALTAAFLFLFVHHNLSINKSGHLFGDNDTIPFDSESPDVKFVLFTKQRQPYFLQKRNKRALTSFGFNNTYPTKIIIHGFWSSIDEDVFKIIKDAYLDSGDFNIIGMDWSKLCKFAYITSVFNVEQAGRSLANLLIWLLENNVNANDIHLIGHSLGAHVAGIAAHLVHRTRNQRINRITGLDPASPGFEHVTPDYRLDENDAQIVDVIHTHIAILSFVQPLGYVDFYPNGGRAQPGCPDIRDIVNMRDGIVCNHARAYRIFAESIVNKNAFKARKCNSVNDAVRGHCYRKSQVRLGQIETYTNMSGVYYLITRAKEPFSLS